MDKIGYRCSKCGSDSIKRDAWAVWDEIAQSWEIYQVFDECYCHACEESTRAVRVALEDSVPHVMKRHQKLDQNRNILTEICEGSGGPAIHDGYITTGSGDLVDSWRCPVCRAID